MTTKYPKLIWMSLTLNILFFLAIMILAGAFFMVRSDTKSNTKLSGFYKCEMTSEFANDANRYEFQESIYDLKNGSAIGITYYDHAYPSSPGCTKNW